MYVSLCITFLLLSANTFHVCGYWLYLYFTSHILTSLPIFSVGSFNLFPLIYKMTSNTKSSDFCHLFCKLSNVLNFVQFDIVTKCCLQSIIFCCYSITQSCLTLWDSMDSSTPGFPVLHNLLSLLKCMSIELVMPSNHLIPCRPLLLLPSIFPSIRVFSKESVLHIRWPKY